MRPIIFFTIWLLTSISNHKLEIQVTLPENTTGDLYLVIYNNKTDFLGDKGELHIFDSSALLEHPIIELNNLEEGTYAFVAFIDENNNGVMDKNRLGIPKEPVGFSVSRMGLFGPPSFKKASYQIPENKSVELVIERF